MIAIDELRRWIGREESCGDVITTALAERFEATLGLDSAQGAGAPAPRLIHLCLGLPAVPAEALGPDGHPARGGFLPPVPLPNRMWAGGRFEFERALRVGDTVTRTSRIDEVSLKQGRSGTLCFVTVTHRVAGPAGAVSERQDIVYRDGTATARPAEPAGAGQWSRTVDASPVTLFRYSAITFNGHRIHYDQPYATGVEGYPGLVVHGPLQATWLYHFAAELRDGAAPDIFEFRSRAPLFDVDTVTLNAARRDDGTMALWTAAADGPVAMEATAQWI